MTELSLSARTLAFFLDETGHERFADSGHPVFGMGGCAVLGSGLDAVVISPWRSVRKAVRGDADLPLHASEFSRTATPVHIQAVSHFFATQPLARLALVMPREASLRADLTPDYVALFSLMRRIENIAKWQPFSDIALIFEQGSRIDREIEKLLSYFSVTADGHAVPVRGYFLPKKSMHPALEVADFIMHAVGQQVRHRARGRPGFLRNFQAVFHGIDRRLTSFVEVEHAD